MVPQADRDPSWDKSNDIAWTTSNDAEGFHVLAARARDGYQWRTVASLREPGFEADQWIGNACVTGSGRRIVATYAPRTFANRPELFDRGGFTAVVDLSSGTVRKLKVRSTLAYYSPGCGAGETATISEHRSAATSAQSRVTLVDAVKGGVRQRVGVDGDVTSAVPVGGEIVAASSKQLLRLAPSGKHVPLTRTTHNAYRLTATADGGVAFLDYAGDKVRVQKTRVRRAAGSVTLATGALNVMDLLPGAHGKAFVVGRADTMLAPAPRERDVTFLDLPKVSAVSTEGRLAVVGSRWQPGPAVGAAVARPVDIDAVQLKDGRQMGFGVTPTLADGMGAGAVGAAGESLKSMADDTNPVDTDRTCSVPRNDLKNQVLQPKPRQVEWAVNQAIFGQLKVQRPSNWMNSGMPAYSPQELFPPIPLDGGGRVPAQIMLGIIAQESNMLQASPLASPGETGNPHLGNFYGRDLYNKDEKDDWTIRFDHADCGYGLTQVTDGMRLKGKEKPGETALPWNSQRAVALDFAANIAEGLRILQKKWNQTRQAGLIANNGKPESPENWFFALWAYNSGFYPNKGDGQPWGLGWMNNPANPHFLPNRGMFHTDPEHAKYPNKWSYPERVIGWAAYPIEAYENPTTPLAGYRAAWWTTEANRESARPANRTFCKKSNDCSEIIGEVFLPNAPDDPSTPGDESTIGEPAGPCAHRNAAGKYDLKCWWHSSATWKNCPADCGNEVVRFNPGYEYPANGDSNKPVCNTGDLPARSLVIDDLPDNVPAMREESPGRPCVRVHENAGTFNMKFSSNSSGLVAKVDTHQLGAGFNGHTWVASMWSGREPKLDQFGVTGTWQFSKAVKGWHRVLVHIPNHAVHTQSATYTVETGKGRKVRKIQQRIQRNKWVSLGAIEFDGKPSISLNNRDQVGEGEEGIAWDAVALAPLPSKPKELVVSLGDSYSSGEAAGDYYPETDVAGNSRYQNACHRSPHAWSRKATLPGLADTIGTLVDRMDSSLDYHMIACSGARTWNVIPFYSVPEGRRPTVHDLDKVVPGKPQHRLETQLDQGFVDKDTTLVTLSIGGNDSGFGKIIQECIVFNCADETQVPDDITKYVVPSIITTIAEINKLAPNARILLMGYPSLLEFPGKIGCYPTIDGAERMYLGKVAEHLAKEMGRAAEAGRGSGIRVKFANPVADFAGKGVCGDPEAVVGMISDRTPGEADSAAPSQQSFHPNKLGTSLYADVMNRVVKDL